MTVHSTCNSGGWGRRSNQTRRHANRSTVRCSWPIHGCAVHCACCSCADFANAVGRACALRGWLAVGRGGRGCRPGARVKVAERPLFTQDDAAS